MDRDCVLLNYSLSSAFNVVIPWTSPLSIFQEHARTVEPQTPFKTCSITNPQWGQQHRLLQILPGILISRESENFCHILKLMCLLYICYQCPRSQDSRFSSTNKGPKTWPSPIGFYHKSYLYHPLQSQVHSLLDYICWNVLMPSPFTYSVYSSGVSPSVKHFYTTDTGYLPGNTAYYYPCNNFPRAKTAFSMS